MMEVLCFDRGVRRASQAEIRSLVRLKKRLWIDLISPTESEVALLKEAFSLHPITAEDIVTKNTRVKVEVFENYMLVVLYGIYKNKNIRLRETDFVLGKNFLITSHTQKIEAFDSFKADKKLASISRSGMDFLMHSLVDMEVDNFLNVLEQFNDVVDKIEDRIMKRPDPAIVEKILDLKRRVNRIKKIVVRQQEKISFLAKNQYALISPECQTYFRDVHDHFYTVTDMIEDYKYALAGSLDAYMYSVANTTNKVMKLLSIVATIVLPLTVISSIYGMNLAFLPGSEAPAGFWVIIGIMLTMVGIMLTFFKRRGWLRSFP